MTEHLGNVAGIHGPIPFWFINGDITHDQIESELDAMLAAGITEVMVHPRYGITIDYLSDEWFRTFDWCLKQAKARGMHIWIYDELNWPSGTAGTTVQADHLQYMSKYLSVRCIPRSDIDLAFFEPGQLLLAARVQGGVITKTKALPDLQSLRALDEGWRVFNCHIKRDKFYIDTLSKAAVDCFKHRTHEQYRKHFGSEFGKTIRGFFTDEPSIYWVSVGYDDWTIPYTEQMFRTFEERYKYSALPNIPYLFLPGRDAASFRADFWEHVSYLFNNNYHANLAKWCKSHKLLYTGHTHCEEPLRYQIRFQGDMFGAMKEMDIPGVDHLEKGTLGNRWISIIGHKIASSHAHSARKPRVLSESFGVTGWDVTYQDLKKVVDWQFALGVNTLVPHALFHTIAGPMKREAPPSFFVQSPMWQDFDAFSQYINRLSDMLTGGKHICHILILYPLTGLYAAYQPDRKTQEFECIDNVLNSLCLELMMRQMDYDLVDFPTLSEATVNNGRIKLGDEQYDVLIIPYTPYMRPKEYEAVGNIAKQVETYFFYRSADPVPANEPSSSNGVQFVATEDLPGFVMRLRHSIDDGIHLNGTGREDILLLQREKDGKRIAFLANRSEHALEISARFTEKSKLTLISPETGVETPLPSKIVDKKAEAMLHFAPYQSWLLVIEKGELVQETETELKPREIELQDVSVDVGENVAVIYGFHYTDGNEQIDVRNEPRFAPVYWDLAPPDFKRFAGTYETKLQIEDKPEFIRLVVDRDYSDCQVTVNGTEIFFVPTQRWLTDPSDLAADVTHLLKQGENVVRVVSPTRLSEPIRFAGDFDVDQTDDGIVIKVKTDRYPFHLEEPMPYYSGTVVYTADFDLDNKPARVELDLGDVWDAATVFVNGEPAGKRLWTPYVFDITDYITSGSNHLRIETRSNLANILLGRHRPFGLRRNPVVRVWE